MKMNFAGRIFTDNDFAMIYQFIKPRPELQEFVRDYLIIHLDFDKRHPIPYKPFPPKPEQGLMFFPTGAAVTLENPLTGTSIKPSAVSVFGQQVSKLNFHLPPEYLMVKVHFNPGILFRLLSVPLDELKENCFDAEAMISGQVREVNEQLANANSYEQMVKIVESYLMLLIRRMKKEIHPVDKVTNYLLKNPSRFSLDRLANEACLSPRQFDRKFIERVGISPKLYSRIVRFNQAYNFKEANPEASWFTIALEFGYNDYQHLVKDFKNFSNVSPLLLKAEDDRSPEKILHLLQ